MNKKDDDDDISLLEEISQADEEAGQRFLEFLVIRRRSSVRCFKFLLTMPLSMCSKFFILPAEPRAAFKVRSFVRRKAQYPSCVR